MTPGQALLRMCSPQLPKTTYESIKEKKEKTKHKKDDNNITELSELTKLLSVGLTTTSPNDLTPRLLNTNRKKLDYDKLKGLTAQLNFQIPDIDGTNIMDEESCVECHTSFEQIGNSFLTMFNNTFVSELPFDE